MSSLHAIRASGESNAAEQKRNQERKKNLLVLVHNYLLENGYIDTYEKLTQEAGSSISKFTIADNIDLSLILSDFEAYYEMRFDRKPKLIRPKEGDEGSSSRKGIQRKSASISSSSSSNSSSSSSSSNSSTSNSSSNSNNLTITSSNTSNPVDFNVTGTTLKSSNVTSTPVSSNENKLLLKPPPHISSDPELKQLALTISREIYQYCPNVHFDDIIELTQAKRLLSEAIELPLKFPSFFYGILKPWKGILLHGPPGTGKTLLAKAVATQYNTTFFNISASSLISKWRGDSEKLVRCLFELARCYAPSTIFIDEIDSLLTSRDSDNSEHEASRRLKTELLIQMDGLNNSYKEKDDSNSNVFVMAASNLPWDLDNALLRRLEKRVLVNLPKKLGRKKMFQKFLSDRINPSLIKEITEEEGCEEITIEETDYNKEIDLCSQFRKTYLTDLSNVDDIIDFDLYAKLTEGYSGADIELVCREAAMMPLRRLLHKVEKISNESTEFPNPTPPISSISRKEKTQPPQPINNTKDIKKSATSKILPLTPQDFLTDDPVTNKDILTAIKTTKSTSTSVNIKKYDKWQEEYGAV